MVLENLLLVLNDSMQSFVFYLVELTVEINSVVSLVVTLFQDLLHGLPH